MKAASAEALWDTEDPASFSLLTSATYRQTRGLADSRPGCAQLLYYNQLSGKVTGINDLQCSIRRNMDRRLRSSGRFYLLGLSPDGRAGFIMLALAGYALYT